MPWPQASSSTGGKQDDVLAFLGERLAVPVAAATASRPLAIDGALSSAGANIELMELLDRAGPYGPGHPEPRFVFPAHRLSRVRIINDEHVRCTLIRRRRRAPRGLRLPRRRHAAWQAAAQGEGHAAACCRASPPRQLAGPGRRRAHVEDAAEPREARASLPCAAQSFLYDREAAA